MLFKKVISIILCVIVLASFSLSAFASYSTLSYENINCIQESFVASFLSHCGVEVEFFDWDIEYSDSEFKNAAWCNLTREFLNYVDSNDSKLSVKILDYASSCGLDSSIQSSSFVWHGSFKDCREIVNQLVYHFYNFLNNYDNVYGYCDVPLSMYVGEDSIKYTGVWSRVTFLGIGSNLDSWYNNVGQVIQSYCTGNYVDDDFEECYINYYWDYEPLPLGFNLYLDVLEDYIDNYEFSSGDSSGDSSDTSSDTSSGDSSDDSELIVNSADVYYSSFYPSLFYSCLSSYDVNIFSIDYSSVSLYYGPPTFTDIEYVLNRAFSIVFQGMLSGKYDDIYPTALTDFKNIAHSEYDSFIDSDITFYQINFNSSSSYNRFYYGFYEMFFSTFDDVDDELNRSDFGNCELFSFDGMTLCFSYDVSENIGQGSWRDCGFYDKFYNFTQTYKGPLLVPFYKDTSFNFIDYTWNHVTYDWSTTFKMFSGFSIIEYHENQPSNSIEFWKYDKNALYENWSDLIKIEVIIVPVPDGLESSLSSDFLASYINSFFLWSETFLGFLRSCISLFPSAFMGIIVGGFILLIVTRFLLYK